MKLLSLGQRLRSPIASPSLHNDSKIPSREKTLDSNTSAPDSSRDTVVPISRDEHSEETQPGGSPQPIDFVPPQDRGNGAWRFLAAASVILQVTWGFTISFGVFRDYYFGEPRFAGVQSVAEVGVMSTGLIQALSPFLVRYLSGRPQNRKRVMWVGTVICVAASVGAGFARTPVQLIMTQGVLYGIGSGLLFAPSISFVDEWFLHRRSLAYGIYFGASSLAAAILPPVLSALLSRYGSRTTMISWAIFAGAVISLALLCVRPRLQVINNAPISEKSPLSGDISYGFFAKPLFWLVLVSNILQASAQYLPSVYLPSYATDLQTPTEKGSLLLTYYNLASVTCQPFIGILADKRGVLVPLLLSTVIPTVAVLLVWGFAHAYWTLAIVSILFGGLSGGYVVLRNRFATAIVGDSDHPNQELIVSGLIMFVRGCASVGSGFIGAAVVADGESSGITQGYGSGRWRPLILTIGILSGASTIGSLGFLRGNSGRVKNDESGGVS